MAEEHRLDRIEEKLDKLSEAVVCLARMEERLITIFNRLEKIGANNKGKKDNLIPGKSPNIKNPKDNLFLATR